MSALDEAQEAILKKIAEIAPQVSYPPGLRDLAEALAWAGSPNQPHGGSTTVSVGK